MRPQGRGQLPVLSYLFISPSVRKEQLEIHQKRLRKILCLEFLLKFLNFFSQSKFSRKNTQ
jgi:hypothetical protein